MLIDSGRDTDFHPDEDYETDSERIKENQLFMSRMLDEALVFMKAGSKA